MKALRVLGFSLLSLLILFVALNLFDEEISPKVQSVIDEKPQPASEKQMEAYKFYLGLGAPLEEDPVAFGEKLIEKYQKRDSKDPNVRAPNLNLEDSGFGPLPNCASLDCPIEKIREMSPAHQSYLLKVKPLLDRYDRMVATDSELRWLMEPNGGGMLSGSVNLLLKLSKIKLLEVSELVAIGDYDSAMNQLNRSYAFFLRSASSPNSSHLETAVILVILKDIRRRLKFLSSEDLQFAQKAQEQGALITRPNDLKFLEIARFAAAAETKVFYQYIMKGPNSWSLWSDGSDKSPMAWLINFMDPILFKPQKTINRLFTQMEAARTHECITQTEIKCTEIEPNQMSIMDYLINPLGNIFVSWVPYLNRYERIYKDVAELSTEMKI